jgi:hypothetical protein
MPDGMTDCFIMIAVACAILTGDDWSFGRLENTRPAIRLTGGTKADYDQADFINTADQTIKRPGCVSTADFG